MGNFLAVITYQRSYKLRCPRQSEMHNQRSDQFVSNPSWANTLVSWLFSLYFTISNRPDRCRIIF